MSECLRQIRKQVRMSPWCALALAASGLVGAAPAAAAPVRVLESDETRVLVEITPGEPQVESLTGPGGSYVRLRFPGAGMTEEEGKPEVPRGSVQVALPVGARPRLRVVSQQWSSSRPGAVAPLPERVGVHDPFGPDRVVEREPVETDAYTSLTRYPAQPFALSEVRDLRGLRTVNVVWYGVIAEVAARSHRVLRSAVLEVVFEEDPARAAAPVTRPAPSDALWERTRRGVVTNAEQAGGWARGGPADGPTVGDTPWGAGSQVRVRIDETGPVSLSWTALAGAGFPAGTPVTEVAVYQRSFDMDSVDDPAVAAADLFEPIPVPSIVRDDGNGILDGNDTVLFYARSFRDEWMTSGWEYEDLFQTSNFYWVRSDPAGGARMALRAAQPASAAAESLDSTPSRVFREEDRRYYDHPADMGPGAAAFEAEFFYWNNAQTPTSGETGWTLNDSFDAPDPVAGRPATLVSRVCGGGRPVHNGYTNIVRFSVNGTQVGEDQFYNNSLYVGNVVPPDRVLWTHTVPANILAGGPNTFTFNGRTYTGFGTGTIAFVARFFLDWYELAYDRQLVARSGALLLTTENGSQPEKRIRVRGFAGQDLLLWDVTDPANPVQVAVDPSQVVSAGGGTFDLRFGHLNTGGPAAYLAVREAEIPAVASSELDAVPAGTLLAGGVGARWVAVAYDDFVAGTQELAAHRAGRYTVQVAPLSEVYDVFGNGARHPDAIKAYAAYAYHRWTEPIAFLVLVGDASEDHRSITVEADVDYLPSHSLWTQYEGAPEDTDQYYAEVTRAAPGGEWDDLSDIFVGRLSVGTPEELSWNVERIVRYETGDPDGVWRRRVVLLSDDAFSGSLGAGFGDPYEFRLSELDFCRYSRLYADSLAAHPWDAVLPDVVCMGDWSHPCADACYYCTTPGCDPDTISCEATPGVDCGIWYRCRTSDSVDPNEWLDEYSCMRDRMKTSVLPELRNRLSDGALIWNFQGHANRFFLTHEEIWRDDPISARHDVETLTNWGEPFVFLGFACHLAEFDKSDERVNEDCMSEKLMNVQPFGATGPGGAIAAFASSGFEFLIPNLSFNQHVMDAFFYPEKAANPANVDSGGATLPPPVTDGVYRWTLGESTTRARLMHQNDFGPGQTRQAAQRFVLLGDPAVEPNLGAPTIEVAVNGLPVQDPAQGFFLDPESTPGAVSVRVTATDGRGIGVMRIVDSVQGEIPAADYQLTVDDQSPDGVALRETLDYEFEPRTDVYTLSFQAVDGSGSISRFDLTVTNAFVFTGGEPAVYPNPFGEDTWFVYRLTKAAESVNLSVYTVAGRKIRELTQGARPANEQLRIRWDGRDDHGNQVANGTYFLVLSVSGEGGEIRRTIPVSRFR